MLTLLLGADGSRLAVFLLAALDTTRFVAFLFVAFFFNAFFLLAFFFAAAMVRLIPPVQFSRITRARSFFNNTIRCARVA